MRHAIPKDALAAIPYLNVSAIGSFTVWAQPLWDGQKFRQWFFDGSQMVEAQMPGWIEGMYFAEAKANPTDAYILFVDALVRFASAPGTSHWYAGIVDDVRNICAALWRSQFLANEVPTQHVLMDLVACEYEFILGLCRSLFDCLQEAISTLWSHVMLTDPREQARKRALPKSFAAMCLHGEEPLEPDALVTKYAIPIELATAYHQAAVPFAALRRERDDITHRGHRAPTVFLSPHGPGIDVSPTVHIVHWEPEELLPNNIGSFCSFLAKIVYLTLDLCDKVTLAYFAKIAIPEPMVRTPFKIFYRSPVSAVLNQIDVVRNGAAWPTFDLAVTGTSIQHAH